MGRFFACHLDDKLTQVAFHRYTLLGSLTARDTVALPAVYMGMGGKERSTRAEKLLQDLGWS